MEEAQERADIAESQVNKLRAKSRELVKVKCFFIPFIQVWLHLNSNTNFSLSLCIDFKGKGWRMSISPDETQHEESYNMIFVECYKK